MGFAENELDDTLNLDMQDEVLEEAASEVSEAEPEAAAASEAEAASLAETLPKVEGGIVPEPEADELAEAGEDEIVEVSDDDTTKFVPWAAEHIASAEPKPFTHLAFDSIALELDGKELFGATTIAIDSPKVIAIVGPAAARKALLLAIAGLAKPTSGSISIDSAAASKPAKQLKSAVGIALFKGLNDLDDQLTVEQSVIKDLSMLRRRAKDDDVDQLLEDWDLDGIESEKVATIEPHDRIRLGIALASIGSPSTIVIDDIETGMGAQDTLHMLNYLSNVAKTQGIAFVIGLSDDLYAKYADECIAIGS
ncbi:MAG: ATP-binding cassette domain-containing protein [bacterium]|nr:ATP-binding cassette domain-containing protein [bacterium]